MGWRCCDRLLSLDGPPLVMGILNVTPDSFSDGGDFVDVERAVAHGRDMLHAGAAIIDVGGESTRPGAEAVSAGVECQRVIPIIRALAEATDAVISIDTMKADVARAAIEAGACIVNDVSACTHDAAMVNVLRSSGAGVVLMHMQGMPRTMQQTPSYQDAVSEIRDYLVARAQSLEAAGVAPECIAIDPGIGFGKTLAHNLQLLAHIDCFAATGFPVLVGLSRKRCIGDLTGRPPKERLAGSLAGLAAAVSGGARIMRVHDVAPSVDVCRVTWEIASRRNDATGQ